MTCTVMQTVQPLAPPETPLGIQLINDAAPYSPVYPTTVGLISTMPLQRVNRSGAIPQMPNNIINALVNQQAVSASVMTAAEKNTLGIVTKYGANLNQLSAPGQYIKPGAGEFIQQLTNKTSLPMPVVASGALMTGLAGVTTATALLNNLPAQLSTMAKSIVKSTTELTNSGILSGLSIPSLDSAGIIQAGSMFGTQGLITALKDPLGALNNLSTQGTELLNSIASGNFAAGLADTFNNGLSGVVTSISGLANNAAGALTSGLSGLTSGLGGIASGLGGLATGLLGKGLSSIFGRKTDKAAIAAAEQAFRVAESSFGSLKANQINFLGGDRALVNELGEAEGKLLKYSTAADTVSSIEDEIVGLKKQYADRSTPDILQKIRKLEKDLSNENQKVVSLSNSLVSGQGGLSIGNMSAQKIISLAKSLASGQLTQPNALNSGINSIPGGLSAFANIYNPATSQVLDVIKNSGITNPKQLVGNIAGNIAGQVTAISNSVVGAAQSIIPGANNLLSTISALGSQGPAAILGKIGGSLSSFGRAPGQIKSALLGTKTGASINAVVSSTLNATLDPKIPPPVFSVVPPTYTADVFKQSQIQAQSVLNNLIAERETVQLQIDRLYDDFFDNEPIANATTLSRFSSGPLVQIEKLRQQLDLLDKKILTAQENYERLITF